ncbi:MAG: hypothetical protein CNIPEHKO_03374 [Anaerolineales bacterium]|nr:hypothetical protein [Anaerolineales bacterium]
MRVIFGDRAARAHARTHARREIIAQLQKLSRSLRPQHALARVQIRLLGIRQQLSRLLDPLWVARAHIHFAIARRRIHRDFLHINFHAHQFIGDGEEGGTRSARERGAESGTHHLRQSLRLTDQRAIFGDRFRHLDEVGRLPRAAPLRVGGEAPARAGNRKDGMSLRKRAGNARQHIRRARSRRADDDAWLAVRARVALRQMHRAFFVSAVDVTDAIARRVRRERDVRPVNDAEHHLDALGLQTLCQQFSNGYFSHVVSFLIGRG